MKTKNFIEKAKLKHGNKYDYSLIKYINNETEVEIICPIHGIFKQKPKKHINRGQNCPKCTGHFIDKSFFIEKANKIHNNFYDYSLVEYKDSTTKIKIICPIHGIFEQTPNAHLSNKNCYKCTGTPKKTTETFINEANNIHKNKYDYSLTNYQNNSFKVSIICKIHGIFKQTPAAHLRGQGCPICRESKGEILIRNFLENNLIKFKPQHRFKDCKHKLPLPFDFYLPTLNLCIEFHGHQHYLSSHNFGAVKNEFELIQIRDKIKIEYCIKNNISLLIIPYYENASIILSNFFSTYKFKTTT
jgi:hypothetical protein